MNRFLVSAATLATLTPFGAVPGFAQIATVQTTTDADRLADQVRRLAIDPRDLTALIEAGRLTTRLGDPTAANTFYARAERLAPRDPRVMAGTAAILVQMERPGEALRRFAEAESMGADLSYYAADRALAYDLTGDQGRAQMLYKSALARSPDDGEILRRYALSLGISGRKDRALAVLDPLLRQSDRGAWRSRAFILAMGGDVAGAQRIATSMMPPGLANGLQPFFERLPALPAVDRAYAVHFGEVRPTSARLADAQLAPRLALMPVEQDPVAVAALAPAKKAKRSRKDRDVVQMAQVQPVAADPPRYVAPPAAPMVQPLPGTRVAANDEPDMRVPIDPNAPQPVVVRPAPIPAPVRQPPVQMAAVLPAPRPVSAPVQPVVSAVPVAVAVQPVQVQPLTLTPVAPIEVAAVPRAPAGPPASLASSPPQEVPVHIATVSPTEPLPAVPPRAAGGDPVLAAIVANISVPASELGVEPMPGAGPAPAAGIVPAPVVIAPPPSTVATKKVPVTAEVIDPKTKKPVDPDAKAKKVEMIQLDPKSKKMVELQTDPKTKKLFVIDPKTKERIAIDPKTKKPIPPKPDPAKLEPERIWVQVAGGASESDLAKEWKRVTAKAPAAFKGKTAWTTPLRATNRVLAGPFKTDDDARAFVNTLAKEGISAFPFTSDAGQKISKLATK